MIIEARPFNLEQVKLFLHGWYLETQIKEHGGKDDLGVRQEAGQQADRIISCILGHDRLAALAQNPLLLTMIATVHHYRGALRGLRHELYEEICDVLLGRRQDAKGITDPMTANQKQKVLQVLALHLMEKEQRSFTLPEAATVIASTLADSVGRMDGETFLKQVEENK